MHNIDANQPEIVDALRAVGATVQSLASVGVGCPDILVGYQSRNFLMEIKTDTGKLRATQKEWHALWRGQVVTIRSVDAALKVIGVSY